MTLKIYFDGLCEPTNPNGIATYGYVVYRNGKLIKSDSGVIGEGKGMTNNVAEYSALLMALRWIKEHNFVNEIIVMGDSKLVIQQLNGNWKIKSKTSKDFVPKIKSLLNGTAVKFQWVSREKNKEADKLSRMAYEYLKAKRKG